MGGRPSAPVEMILRMLVVTRLDRWGYDEPEHCVADSLGLRQYCRIDLEAVPDDITPRRWADLLGPTPLVALNDRIVERARSLKATRGGALRVDNMVVATTVPHPTDGGLIGDGMRLLSRLLRRANAVPGRAVGAHLPNTSRTTSSKASISNGLATNRTAPDRMSGNS